MSESYSLFSMGKTVLASVLIAISLIGGIAIILKKTYLTLFTGWVYFVFVIFLFTTVKQMMDLAFIVMMVFGVLAVCKGRKVLKSINFPLIAYVVIILLVYFSVKNEFGFEVISNLMTIKASIGLYSMLIGTVLWLICWILEN